MQPYGLVHYGLYLFINNVSKDAEEVLHPDKRKAMSDELLRIKDRDASSWVPDFMAVFDRFFWGKTFKLAVFLQIFIDVNSYTIYASASSRVIDFTDSCNLNSLSWVSIIAHDINFLNHSTPKTNCRPANL